MAARIVKAEGSFLLLNIEGHLTAVQSFNVTGLPENPTWDLITLLKLSTLEGLRSVTAKHQAEDGSTLAAVAIQKEGVFLGVLGMRNPNPTSFIPSQEYVIQAIAFEIAEHLVAKRPSKPETGKLDIDLIARLRLLESVVINANDSILITEAEPLERPGPRIVYANPAFTRTTGYSMAEVLGKSPRLLQGPLTAPDGPARIHAALKAWEPIEVELLNYRKDGTTFWVELSISPVCDETGWYTHWVSVQRDMTERKALDALSASPHARSRILLVGEDAGMREHIVGILGHDYEIETVCNVEEALRASVTALPDLVLYNFKAFQVGDTPFVSTLRTHAITKALPIILISAGIEEQCRAQCDEGDANDYLIKPFSPREIKARVRTQLELQSLKRDLSAKEEFIRTTEILRKSEKLAVVGRMASSIAHEIANPLEAVTNLLYLAESSLGESEAGNFVRQAQAEVARAANIATQTLQFHRKSIVAQPTLLHEVLENTLTLFQGRPGSADVVTLRQYRTQRPVKAFEADLRQVFANLIGNALDASSKGGKIILRVREASHTATGKAGIFVLVADNGQGMTEEIRKRVFEPFFTTKGMTGTGLGLWVSSEILNCHNARIRVRSSRSPARHGTVFSIFFPFEADITTC